MNLDLEMGTKGLERPEECAEINAEWARGMLSLGSGKTAMCIICAVLACIILWSSTSVRPGRRLVGMPNCVNFSAPLKIGEGPQGKIKRDKRGWSDHIDSKYGNRGFRFNCSTQNLMRCELCGCAWDVIDFIPDLAYFCGATMIWAFEWSLATVCLFDCCGNCGLYKSGCEYITCEEEMQPNCCVADDPACLGFTCDSYCADVTKRGDCAIDHQSEPRGGDIRHQGFRHWNLFEIACCGFGCSFSPCLYCSDKKETGERCCIKGYGTDTYTSSAAKNTATKHQANLEIGADSDKTVPNLPPTQDIDTDVAGTSESE